MTWEWRDSGPLKPGLPGILTRDPQRLCEMLGVNRKERRKQWSEAKADEKALVQETMRTRGDKGAIGPEVALILERWANPQFRRDAWERVLAGTPVGPPSLTFRLLEEFVDEERSAGEEEEDSRGRTEAIRIAHRAWDHTWTRLQQWDELEKLDREECILRLFAVATVLDEQGVLAEACRRVPALREEFGTMVPDEPDPVEEWTRLCARMGELAQKAAGPPPEPDRIVEMASSVEDLERIEMAVRDRVESAALDALLEAVRVKLKGIAADPDFAWFAQDTRAAVMRAWEAIEKDITPDQVDEERERFEAAVPRSMEAARDAEAERARAEQSVLEHREKRPPAFAALKKWAASLRKLQAEEHRRQEALWKTQSALVAAASPFGKMPETEPPEPDDDPGLPEPNVGPASPESEGGAEPVKPTDPPTSGKTNSDDAAGSPRTSSDPTDGEDPVEGVETGQRPAADDADTRDAEEASDAPAAPVRAGDGQPEESGDAVETTSAPEAGGEDDSDHEVEPDGPRPDSRSEPEGERDGDHGGETSAGSARTEGGGSDETLSPRGGSSTDGDPDQMGDALEAEQPGAESGAEAESGKEQAPDPLVLSAEEAVFKAIAEDPPQLAFAVQTARLLEQEAPDWAPGGSRLLEGVLLADRLRLADGRICGSLAEVFGAFPGFDSDLDEEEQAFQIACRFSASLVPSLLAPNSGALAILRNLPSGPFPALRELAHSVSDHLGKLQTAHIGIHLLRRLRSDAAAAESRRQVEREVAEWRRDAPRRTMKYQPATAVWKHWLQDHGWIGDLMGQIQRGAESETELRSQIQRLRSDDELRRRIKDTDRELRGRIKPGSAIRWRAFAQLVTEARKAADLAEKHLTARAAAAGGRDFRLTVLSALRREVDGCAKRVLAELEAARNRGPGWSSSGAWLAQGAVREFRGLLHGAAVERETTEPRPEELLASGFYGFGIVLDRKGGPRGEPREVIEALAGATSLSAPQAIRSHLSSGELGMAQRILDWSRVEDGDGLEDLHTELKEVRESRLETARQRLQNLEDRMESGLILGSVSADQRLDLEGVFVEARRRLDEPGFLRFDEIERSLERSDNQLRKMTREHLERVRRELADLALEDRSKAKRAIERAIEQGDIVTANELIGQVRGDANFVPPEAVPREDLFVDFFAEGETATASALEQARGSGRIVSAIRSRKPFPGVPSSLPGARLDSAVRMLEAWYSLKRHERLAPIYGVVKQLFTEMGFADVSVTPLGSETAKLTTVPLKSKWQCPVPRYGSAARGRYQVVFQWGRPAIADLMQYADRDGGDPPILLYFGRLSARQRSELAQASRRSASTLLVLDETVLVSLCGERESRLPALFHRTLPFTFVQPYITTGGEVPPEMFYGRSKEKRDVASPRGPCFIYGGRQLGKTAILRAVRAEANDPKNDRYAFFIDLKAHGIGVGRDATDLWPLLWQVLRDGGAIPVDVRRPARKSQDSVKTFLDRLIEQFRPERGRRLLLLLDEADRFLEVDSREQERRVAASGYPQSIRLKRLMDETDRSIKVVFAGLHNVLRTAERANHPLGQFGRPIQVGPLLHNGEMRRASELLTWPLLAAGYRIASRNLVTRVLAQTNFYPGLIQACGEELVGTMATRAKGQPLYDITAQVVEETYRGGGLREFIRTRFQLTLDLDQRYEVIAYAIARLCAEEDDLLVDGVRFARIQSEALEWWEDGFRGSTSEHFRSLLQEMEGLGVLKRTGGEHWSLRNPNVLLLMGTQDQIVEKLLQEREPAPEFQRETFRSRGDPTKPSDPGRSPMTFQQEGHLSVQENGIIVLSGVPAAGYETAMDGLRRSESSPAVPLPNASDPESLVADLRDRVAKQKDAVRVYAVPTEVEWTREWLRAARAYLDRLSKPDRWIRLVFPAAGNQLFRFLREEVRTAPWLTTILLEPWHEDYLRQWLQDIGIVTKRKLRRRILDVTGGWHIQLMRYAELVQDGNGEAGLEDLETELKDPTRREDLRKQLCLVDPDTRAVLRPFVVYGDNGQLRRDEARNEAVDQGLTPDEALQRLEWARRMGLVRGGLTWTINPLVARLIGSDED